MEESGPLRACSLGPSDPAGATEFGPLLPVKQGGVPTVPRNFRHVLCLCTSLQARQRVSCMLE